MSEISFCASRADLLLLEAIAKRAHEALPVPHRTRTDWVMDFTATHANGCPLKLQALLDADEFNFLHDAIGICRHLNRETGKLENCFLPRFYDRDAAKQKPVREYPPQKRLRELGGI